MTDKFIPLRADFSASPQLLPGDMALAAADGYTLIVNNRPDGEAPGQPSSAEMEAAARAAGLSYVHIPVDGRGISPDHIFALKKALNETDGKALAFCTSGTRSVYLQAFAEAVSGRPADEIIAEAGQAGYNIAGARQTLLALNENKENTKEDERLS